MSVIKTPPDLTQDAVAVAMRTPEYRDISGFSLALPNDAVLTEHTARVISECATSEQGVLEAAVGRYSIGIYQAGSDQRVGLCRFSPERGIPSAPMQVFQALILRHIAGAQEPLTVPQLVDIAGGHREKKNINGVVVQLQRHISRPFALVVETPLRDYSKFVMASNVIFRAETEKPPARIELKVN